MVTLMMHVELVDAQFTQVDVNTSQSVYYMVSYKCDCTLPTQNREFTQFNLVFKTLGPEGRDAYEDSIS